jgi:hypothetical protein
VRLASTFLRRALDLPEEVPHDRLKDVPSNEDIYILIAQVRRCERNGAGKLVDESHGGDNNAGGGETLGSHGGFECLGGDDTLQGSVGE